MKVLLDECVPAPLARSLDGHDCVTVQLAGWVGIKNGDLLLCAERAKFDVFITADKNLRYQQKLTDRTLAIIELLPDGLRRLRMATAAIMAGMVAIAPGDYRFVDVS
jgi:hypothetical protein